MKDKLPGASRSGVFATVGLVAAATGTGIVARPLLTAPDLVMLFVLAIVIAATRYGRTPALVASALSVLAYDFCFVPPFFTFRVSDERHLLTFGAMFAVGLLISALTERLRRHERERGELAAAAAGANLRARTEEMRSSLLSAVSHDLRTPLGAITGAATTLRDASHAVNESQRAELVEAICDEAERMERLVVNLLEMTRLQAGALVVKKEWVPLEEILGSALNRLEKELGRRPIHLDLQPQLPLWSVDPVLLEQVFVNLLDNAVKYTPPGSAVSISARVEGDRVMAEVRDEGPGLPPGSEQEVFEKFVRAGPREVRGAGLGLAICRGIVEAHGGLLVARNGPQGGAVFSLSLPLGEPPPVPAEPDGQPRAEP